MAVYLASGRDLPLIPWRDDAPGFNVVGLNEHEQAVREQFSKPNVVYLGAHTGCSCGFRYGERDLLDEKDREEDAAARASVAGLRAYLINAAQDGPVELYACWEGDWELPAEHRLEVTPAHFGGDQFRFPERAFFLVRPVPKRDPATVLLQR